jgi:hypothetical protein
MKRVFFAAAAAALATATYLPAAVARDAGSSAATYQVGEAGAAAVPYQASHYEWQDHYVGHHPRFEGHWVLVR